MGVHVLAVAVGETFVGSFYLEPELFVEGYGRRVVLVDAEVQPRVA